MKGFGVRCLFALLASAALATPTLADPFTFQMSWKAQAEQGGYYDALAKGFYKACGLDVTIRQGGPGIDDSQLLVSGAVDAALISQNDGVLRMVDAGFPARAVMAGFQRLPTVLLAHAGTAASVADMRGRPIMISLPNRTTFWPFLKQKYGFADAQLRTYSGQIAVWMADKDAIQQGNVTNEPFLVHEQSGETPAAFLMADEGYDPYTSLIAVSQTLIDSRPQAVKCLVQASVAGWTDYMKHPDVANAVIQKENPQNTDGLLAYAFRTMQERHLIENDDTARLGIGAMTDARWKQHFDMLVAGGLMRPDLDYKSAYTLQFVDKGPAP